MKKILITTYYFYPEITPRAFRAFELAKELSKRDYEIDVFIPENDYDYTELVNKHNIKIHKVKTGFLLNKSSKAKRYHTTKKASNFFIKKLLLHFINVFYIGGRSFEYAFMLYFTLLKIARNVKYEYAISIGLPISVHFGSGMFLKNKNEIIRIADYGDPFAFNYELSNYFYYKYIEKYILRFFDYIVIPTEEAKSAYTYFKEDKFLKVIPQGFDFNEIEVAEYKENLIPTFAYAGIFYEKIRNPTIMFDYLVTVNLNFKFVIYTDTQNIKNMSLLNPYIEKLGNKLIIQSLIPREQCIYELSKMDFIVNQNNLLREQTPSKLIDYYLTKRPIFHFTQEQLNIEKLNLFLSRNFNNIKRHDIAKYNIKNVVNLFIKIAFNE